MAKGTGLVKSKTRYLKLIKTFPERTDFYREQIAKVEEQIVLLKVCRRCGRPLKDKHAQEIGYGKECQAQALAELEAHLNDESDRTNGICAVGKGHGSGVPSGEGLDEVVIR